MSRVSDKVAITRSLLLSRGVINCSTWHRPNVQEMEKLHSNIMYAYRSASASYFGEIDAPISDEGVTKKLHIIAPYTPVRLSRLSLAVRIAAKAPILLKRLLFVRRNCDKS